MYRGFEKLSRIFCNPNMFKTLEIMCSHWTEAKLFKFLRLYKRYECLWNPYSPEYRNYNAKSNAFSQILYEMNVFGLTVNECLNQIKHIRKTYKQEQQRLENLALLGGRGYSNLLWYPLMNSMLSKVIQDEDKLNQAAGDLELVVVPKCLPFNSGDEGNRRNLSRSGYGQRTVSWDYNDTNVCPYSSNSNFEEHMNFCQDPNISSDCLVMRERNDHISSCPTCGYSSNSSCACFSMNNVRYHPNNIGQGYSSRPQINYRPRTSYNYRNGILEINSAVRIPVSAQQSPHCGYSCSVIESVTPEEPEYSFSPISNNYQPEVQTVREKVEEEFTTECCGHPSDDNGKENKVSSERESLKILANAANNNSDSSNSGIKTTSAPIKYVNWSSKRSERVKETVDEILRAQDLLGSIGVTQNSICKNTKYPNSGPDNNKASQLIEQKTHTNHALHSPRVDSKNSVDVKKEDVTFNTQQQSHVDLKTEETLDTLNGVSVKVEQTSTMVSKKEHTTKGNTSIKIPQVKPQCNEDSISAAKCISQSKRLRSNKKTKRTDTSNQSLLEVVNYSSNEEISDLETTQDLVRKSKSIIKRNLTKMLMDFIDDTLNKPDGRSTVNTEERLILKKVAKDLKALGNKNKSTRDNKLAMGNYHQSERNHGMKSCNKTICWREPIEESSNIVPCKSIRSSTSKMKYTKNLVAGGLIQLNKCTGNCFRMMAGADIDVGNDMMQYNLSNRKGTPPKNEITISTDYSTSGNDKETRCENVASPNYKEYSMVSMDKKQQCDDESNCQTVADNNERSQRNLEEYASAEVRSVQVADEVESSDSNLEVIGNKHVKELSTSKKRNHECPVTIDELFRVEESIDLDLQEVKRGGQVAMLEQNFQNQVDDSNNPHSTVQDTGIENCLTIHISVETCESTESEIIDKVVNKITHILRKTLDKNGFTIEKKEFFAKKNLITNDNGEIHRKLVGNETVWKEELRNIIGHLMKQNKAGDPITFKVKTMILPVTNQSNGVTAEGSRNLTSSTKPRRKSVRTKKRVSRMSKTGGNSPVKTTQSKISREMDEFFSKSAEKLGNEGKDDHTRMIKNEDYNISITKGEESYKMLSQKIHDNTESRGMYDEEITDFDSADILLYKSNRELVLKKQFLKSQIRKPKHRSIIPRRVLKNLTQLDKMFFHRLIPRDKDYPHALSKLLKHVVQFGNKFQSDPKKIEKSLRNELQESEFTKRNRKFEQDHHKHDLAAASFCDNLPSGLNGDIDVYLCTEISQEDQSHLKKPADCRSSSDDDIRDDVNQNLLSSNATIPEDRQMKGTVHSCVEKTESRSEQTVDDWDSFSDSNEETEIAKHCQLGNKTNQQISKSSPSDENAVYALTKTTKNTIWYPKHTTKAEPSDTVNHLSKKLYSMSSQANKLKDTPSSQNNCTLSDTVSSNYQCTSQNELRSSKEGSKVSLMCAEFETASEANINRIPKPSESEEGELLLKAKLRAAADNQIRYCCTGDETRSLCTPICDVTSRLRLCAIIKSPNKMSAADVQSNNTCCCGALDNLSDADVAYSKSHMKSNENNVRVENGSVRFITKGCQTDPLKKDSNILHPRKHESKPDCTENLKNSFKTGSGEVDRKNSTVVNSTIVITSENIKQPDNVNISKSAPINRAAIQSNAQNSVSVSLDVPDSAGGSLTLEIKMLQPLFSIELKKECKDPERTETSIKQHSCELSEQSNHHVAAISLSEESAIESSSKNGVVSREERSINCIKETTSINPVNCRGKKTRDQDADLATLTKEEEASGIRISQTCETENDWKKKNEVCSRDSKSLTSATVNKIREDEEKKDCLDPGQCNILLETLGSLEDQEDPYGMSVSELSVDNSEACTEKAILQPRQHSFDQTQSRTIKSLNNAVETSLQYITDPLIRKKLIDVMKYIEDQSQNENYSSETEIYLQAQIDEALERTLDNCEMEVQINSEDNMTSQLSSTKSHECQNSCKSQSVFRANSSRNIEGGGSHVKISKHENQSSRREQPACNSQSKMQSSTSHTLTNKEVANQVSTKGNRTMFPPAGKCSSSLPGKEACVGVIGERKVAGSESPYLRTASKSQMPRIEDPNSCTFQETRVTSKNEQSQLQGKSHRISTFNYSTNEISCESEELENDNRTCNPNVNERSNSSSDLENIENSESLQYYCCYTESTEVDINAFANRVAAQLRELSTEAALRSQQRIQTLISNSRLEWEKNKKHR